MLSLLFQKSLSRSLEGQRERGENRKIQEETRTASPAGAEGTRRDAGAPGATQRVGPRGSAPAEEERQEGGWALQPGPGILALTHPFGAHIHTNTRALEGWPGEAAQEGDKLQAGRRESLVPRKLVGERKTMREEGFRMGMGWEKGLDEQGVLWEKGKALV